MLYTIFIIIILFLIFFIGILLYRQYILNAEINRLKSELTIIVNGNTQHRILCCPSSPMKEIIFLINKLCNSYHSDIMQLNESEQKYKDLMVNLSHDVRTPLASMLGYLELLSEIPPNTISTDISSSLEIINKKAIELSEFVEMLFQWTKLDANEETFLFDTIDVTELSRIILSNWIVALEKNNIDFDFFIPEQKILCYTSPSAYERIINNLIKNIIYHSHATKMSFSLISNNTAVTLIIKDNGIGIKTTEQSLIFERLYQCDISHNSRGNGIGLAIVRELVQKLNGTIKLDSVPNKYTKFSIILPSNK